MACPSFGCFAAAKRQKLSEERQSEHAKIDGSVFGGSGYAEFGKKLSNRAYEEDIGRAVRALSSSYNAYYGELPRTQGGGVLTRINTLSYMISSAMTVEEGALYALAAGYSFDEALALSRDSVKLQEAIAYRMAIYNL